MRLLALVSGWKSFSLLVKFRSSSFKKKNKLTLLRNSSVGENETCQTISALPLGHNAWYCQTQHFWASGEAGKNYIIFYVACCYLQCWFKETDIGDEKFSTEHLPWQWQVIKAKWQNWTMKISLLGQNEYWI